MNYKSIIATALLGASLFNTGCLDEFAEVNSNPSVITKPDIRFLFTKALSEFEPASYFQWFYNNLAYTSPWVQTSIYGEGNSPSLNLVGGTSSVSVISTKLHVEEIKFVLSGMDEAESNKYRNIVAMCDPMMIYLGIFSIDMTGSTAYTDAAKGLHEEILTPAYETQKELFDLWLTQLDATIKTLSANYPDQISLGSQDFVYKGDVEKWAKFANSLKLKIAVRLMHQDKARALKIAEEVASSPVGIMDEVSDGFFYNKGIKDYHFGDKVLNDQDRGVGTEQLISFLVDNKDPRVRLMYQKNDFNSMVVQAFLDAPEADKVVLPPYIKALANIQEENGKQVFKGWKAPGEPWVRYYGAPSSTTARDNAATNNAYFNTDKFKLGNKGYEPLARLNREMLRGQADYPFPDKPGAAVVNDQEDNPWFGLHFSASETNLFLAELSILGAKLPMTAEAYYKAGIRLSVLEYDKLAELNRIPYYSAVHDPAEATISLKDGEIDALLEQPNYKLTGSPLEKLEKVYIQQYVHFILFPIEQYVQVRRSGVPMRGSKILPWMPFTDNDENFPIPRRMTVGIPLETDLMYQIQIDAQKEQGFTGGEFDPFILNSQRVWYDKGAPNFGEGPNNL